MKSAGIVQLAFGIAAIGFSYAVNDLVLGIGLILLGELMMIMAYNNGLQSAYTINMIWLSVLVFIWALLHYIWKIPYAQHLMVITIIGFIAADLKMKKRTVSA